MVVILKGLLQFKWNEELQFSLKIISSMLPATFIGLFLRRRVGAAFWWKCTFCWRHALWSLQYDYSCLPTSANELLKSVRFSRRLESLEFLRPLPCLPGISRSGATISTSVMLGNDKSKAARFSFLMVVPLILGQSGEGHSWMEKSASHPANFTPLTYWLSCSVFYPVLFACQPDDQAGHVKAS